MENPIKNNRIVNDKTFAVRLKNFIYCTDVCDAMSEEEKNYLLSIAQKLINYQIETVNDELEINYLKNINLL